MSALYDIDAEKSVVGSMILEPDCIDTVMNMVRPGDFYNPSIRDIYVTLTEMWLSGQQIESRLVYTMMKDQGRAQGPDTALLIAGCVNHVISTYAVEDYAKIVAEKARIRDLQSTLKAIYEGIESGSVKLSTALSEIKTQCAAISNNTLGGWSNTTFNVGDCIDADLSLKWVCAPMIPRQTITLLHAPGGTGKTLFLTWLAVGIAAGRETIAPLEDGERIEKQSVSIVQLDTSKRRQAEMVLACCEGFNLGDSARRNLALRFVAFPNPHPDLSRDSAGYTAIRSHVTEHQVDLLIIDGLSAIRGDIEENSSEMVSVLLRLRALVNETGVSIIIVHHAKKSEQKTSRGSSSIVDMVDTEISLTRTDQAVELAPGKQRETDMQTLKFLCEMDKQGRSLTRIAFTRDENQAKSNASSPTIPTIEVLKIVQEMVKIDGVGPSKRDLRSAIAGQFAVRNQLADESIAAAIAEEMIVTELASKGTIRHYPMSQFGVKKV